MVVGLHDMGALDLGSRGGFAGKPGQGPLVGGEGGRHELDRHFGLQRLVVRDPYAPHSAFAELAHQTDVRGYVLTGFHHGAATT